MKRLFSLAECERSTHRECAWKVVCEQAPGRSCANGRLQRHGNRGLAFRELRSDVCTTCRRGVGVVVMFTCVYLGIRLQFH